MNFPQLFLEFLSHLFQIGIYTFATIKSNEQTPMHLWVLPAKNLEYMKNEPEGISGRIDIKNY